MTPHTDVLDLDAFRLVMEMHYINAASLTDRSLEECYALIESAMVDNKPINLMAQYGLEPTRYISGCTAFYAASKIHVTYHTLVTVRAQEESLWESTVDVADMRVALATFFREVSSLPDWFIKVAHNWLVSITDPSPFRPYSMALQAMANAFDPGTPSDVPVTLPQLCMRVMILYHSLVRSHPKPMIVPSRLEVPSPEALQGIGKAFDQLKAHAVAQVLPPIASLDQAKLVAIFDAIYEAPTTRLAVMYKTIELLLPDRIAIVQVHNLLNGYEMVRRKEMLHIHQVMTMPAKYGSKPARGITSILRQDSFDRDYFGIAGAMTIIRMVDGHNVIRNLELHCTLYYTVGKLDHRYELVDVTGSDFRDVGFRPPAVPTLVDRAALLGRLRAKAAPFLGVPIPGLPKKEYLADLLTALGVIGLYDDKPTGRVEDYLDAEPYLDAFLNYMDHLYRQEILLEQSTSYQQSTF